MTNSHFDKDVEDCVSVLDCFQNGVFYICADYDIDYTYITKLYGVIAESQGYQVFFYALRNIYNFYTFNESNASSSEKLYSWFNSIIKFTVDKCLLIIDDFDITQNMPEEIENFTINFYKQYPNTKILIPTLYPYVENAEINYLYFSNNITPFFNISLSNNSFLAFSSHEYWNPILIKKLFNILNKSGKKNNIIYNDCIVDSNGNPISSKDKNDTIIKVSEINEQLLHELSVSPNLLHRLSPYNFERVIARMFEKKGFTVKITPQTRDGGKDIFAAKNDLFSFLFYVECKKYAPNRPVGIEVIQRLYGVISAENATGGIIATTSYFTKSAKDYVQEQQLEHRLTLQDYNTITNILKTL